MIFINIIKIIKFENCISKYHNISDIIRQLP